MADIVNAFHIGSKCIIADNADLRGDITIGSGTVIHPRCQIFAMKGPIDIGSDCIIEENVIIVNRAKSVMRIGDENHFQVACRIESPSVGNSNTFAPRSRTSHLVSVGSHCSVGAGCIVLPSPFPPATLPSPPPSIIDDDTLTSDPSSPAPPPPPPKDDIAEPSSSTPTPTSTTSPAAAASTQPQSIETLPDYTQVFSADSRRRIWSGEGAGQARAFHAKHLDYLRETLPKFNKLKMFT